MSSLVVLAAGLGSRYGGLKPLAPVGPSGEALLEYGAFDALQAGFERLILIVRPETETAFRRAFSSGMAERLPISYVHQRLDDLPGGRRPPAGRERPWGTAHGVLAAVDDVEGGFGVVNADDFYGASSYVALAGCLRAMESSSGREMGMVGFRVGDTVTDSGPVNRAVCAVDRSGYLEQITEIERVWRHGADIVYRRNGHEKRLAGDEVVSMNMWAFSPWVFGTFRRRFEAFLDANEDDLAAEFLLPELVCELIVEEAARVRVATGSGPWCGITFPDDEARVATAIARWVRAGIYPKELWG